VLGSILPWQRVSEDLRDSYHLDDEQVFTFVCDFAYALIYGDIPMRDSSGLGITVQEHLLVRIGNEGAYVWQKDVDEWLSSRYPFKWMPQKIKIQSTQENLILDELYKRGLQPLALPRNQSGHPGVKKTIRCSLKSYEVFASPSSFDKAWERLSKISKIAYL
jgi:hypothetical protein